MSGQRGWLRAVRWGAAVATFSAALGLGGCAGFFVDTNSTSTSTVATTGDYAYVVNNATNTLSEYSIGSGALTGISGTPIALTTGLAALSATVSRPNTFVYVGGNGAIACYSIGTGGALTATSAGGGSAVANFISLDTSPDGQWLLALDSNPLTQTVDVFRINTSTGGLTLNSQAQYSVPQGATAVPKQVRISPNAGYVAVSLGTAGVSLFTFNTSTGLLTLSTTAIYASGYSDNAALFDSANAYLYVARGIVGSGSSGIASYSIASGAIPTAKQALATSGSTPYSLVFDSTGGYLYSANRGDGTISGFSVSSGTLTPLTSSPYSSGSGVTALALDNTGTYFVAAALAGGSDVTLYKQEAATPGKLDVLATAVSGTDPAGATAVATTH